MNCSLHVGINYVGTDYELRGCINDARDWQALAGKVGCTRRVSLLEQGATRDSILQGVDAVVHDVKAGETGVITVSAHGTWVPDRDGDEPDKRDEALCPVDMGTDGANLIIDDELHAIFSRINKGATILFVTDTCHSGTVFRFSQFGHQPVRRHRFLPPSHFIRDVSLFARMERAFGVPGGAGKRSAAACPGLIHLSGCRDNEFSGDAEFDGRANGAMSYYALAAFWHAYAASGTYGEAFADIRKALPSWEYAQTPQLNATKADKQRKVFR